MSGRLALRDALGNHAKRLVDRHRGSHWATVSDTSPLTLDMHDYDHPLFYGDDFELSQSVTSYRQAVSLFVGDLVLLQEIGDAWVAVDVVSERAVPALGSVPPAAPKPAFIPFAQQGLYAASWSDYDTSGGYQIGSFVLDRSWMSLRGLVKKATAYVAADVVATLTPGFRPGQTEIFDCMAYDSVMGIFVCRVDVVGGTGASAGQIQVAGNNVPNFSPAGNMGWLSLAKIRFLQER